MQEFIEKLIGRLEEEREISYADFDEYLMKYELDNDFDEDDDLFYKGLIRAIEIVNQLAEEHKQCTLCYLQSPCEYQNADAKMPKTNGGKIRTMSDEELAELLEKIVSGNRDVIGINCGDSKCEIFKCTRCIEVWLQSEAE